MELSYGLWLPRGLIALLLFFSLILCVDFIKMVSHLLLHKLFGGFFDELLDNDIQVGAWVQALTQTCHPIDSTNLPRFIISFSHLLRESIIGHFEASCTTYLHPDDLFIKSVVPDGSPVIIFWIKRLSLHMMSELF